MTEQINNRLREVGGSNARLRAFYSDLPRVALGVALTTAIMACWLACFAGALFFYQWGMHSIVTAPLLVLVLCWLYVGLFIIAHDCMHESFFPRKPLMNRVVGRLCLMLYAGFDYDELKTKHHLHHRFAGTDQDPDFDSRNPQSAWRWYVRFFSEYFSMRPVLWMTGVGVVYYVVFSAAYLNLLVFWALPAILSSAQLFYFGTFQPHRPRAEAFADRHRAHSSDYGWWMSLLTCFHFGHHHTHHKHPCVPWWGLHSLAVGATSSATWVRPVSSNALLAATVPFK